MLGILVPENGCAFLFLPSFKAFFANSDVLMMSSTDSISMANTRPSKPPAALCSHFRPALDLCSDMSRRKAMTDSCCIPLRSLKTCWLLQSGRWRRRHP